MLNTTKNNEKLMIVIFYSWHIYLFITVEKNIYNNKLCVKVFIGYILLDSKALTRQKKLSVLEWRLLSKAYTQFWHVEAMRVSMKTPFNKINSIRLLACF